MFPHRSSRVPRRLTSFSRQLLALCCVAGWAAISPAQTLFVPSGTSGIGASANGNVGIGTANPSYRLEIFGSNGTDTRLGFHQGMQQQWSVGIPASTTRFALRNEDNSLEVLSILAGSGNVGFGTTAPTSKLEVRADGTGTVWSGRLSQSNTQADRQVFLGTYDSKAVVGSHNFALTAWTPLYVNTTDGALTGANVILAGAGNVGIGTSAPATKLEVIGAGESIRLSGSGSGANSLRVHNTGGDAYFGIEGATAGSFFPGALSYSTVIYSGTPIQHIVGGASRMVIDTSGNVGIGTTSPTHKLAVNGTIRAKEVIVDTGWADHVFAADYRLAPLSEVEQHIQQNGHLPDVPSAADVAARGVSVGEMQKILLQKIEELTLHQIRLEKDVTALRAENFEMRQLLQSMAERP